jgi:hypothetical protein
VFLLTREAWSMRNIYFYIRSSMNASIIHECICPWRLSDSKCAGERSGDRCWMERSNFSEGREAAGEVLMSFV